MLLYFNKWNFVISWNCLENDQLPAINENEIHTESQLPLLQTSRKYPQIFTLLTLILIAGYGFMAQRNCIHDATLRHVTPRCWLISPSSLICRNRGIYCNAGDGERARECGEGETDLQIEIEIFIRSCTGDGGLRISVKRSTASGACVRLRTGSLSRKLISAPPDTLQA